MANRSVIFDDKLNRAAANRSEMEGISFSDLVRKAVMNYLLIDPVLMKKAARLSTGLGVAPIEVVANLATGRLAQMEAEREVWGPTGEVIEEFVTLDGETPDGQTLFEMLKSTHLHKEGRRKKEQDEHYGQYETKNK